MCHCCDVCAIKCDCSDCIMPGYLTIIIIYRMEGILAVGNFGEFTAKCYWWNKIWQICS